MKRLLSILRLAIFSALKFVSNMLEAYCRLSRNFSCLLLRLFFDHSSKLLKVSRMVELSVTAWCFPMWLLMILYCSLESFLLSIPYSRSDIFCRRICSTPDLSIATEISFCCYRIPFSFLSTKLSLRWMQRSVSRIRCRLNWSKRLSFCVNFD